MPAELAELSIATGELAVISGLEYTAAFDLTACYDTISRSVIRHLLSELVRRKEKET